MKDKIIEIKIEKTLELVCLLYKYKLITDAFIIGSVAEGTANYYSDIDINLINPLFEINLPIVELRPEIAENSPNIKKLIDNLKFLGVEFKYIKRKNVGSWYQFYKNELFHIMLIKDSKLIKKFKFQIKKGICEWFV